MNRNPSTNNATTAVPTGMKLGYSIGDFGANLAFHTTGFYLMFYFTDVFGILPGLAGTIFLVAKMWDAVSDPIMGTIADNTRSRWGKMRPYLLFGALPLGAAVFLLFYSPDIAPEYRFYYGLIAFILFSTTITIVNVPYLALTPSLTVDSHERSVVTGVRVVFGIVGALAAAGATLPLVGLFGGEDQVVGFRTVGLVYGVVVCVVSLISFLTVRERVHLTEPVKSSFRENLKSITKNRPFIILTLGVFLHMIGMNIMAIVVNYYFKYNLEMEPLIPVAFLALFVTAGASIPLFVFISKKTGKKNAYNIGMGIVAFMTLFIFLLGDKTLAVGGASIPVILVLLVLVGVGLSTNWLSPWSMIPDTVEYSQHKTGLRREGILYGVFYFVFKAGTALAGFMVGRMLDVFGYVANETQTDGALLGIRVLLTLVPMAFLTGGIIVISLYPIDAESHRKMVEEIEKREEN